MLRERTSEGTNQRPRLPDSSSLDSGILNERVLVLVFQYLNWDLQSLCRACSVSRRLRAVAKRLLWRQLCAYHAPRMMRVLTDDESNTRIIGGWHPLAKLMLFCGGCQSTSHFRLTHPSSGHLVETSRFSKTSGRSFLLKRCRGDVLYISDPCEHAAEGRQDLIGIYRGVFRAFIKSRTRDCLIRRRAELEDGARCPYCGARVWSMTAARMIPRRSAARRLGSSDGALEYFVCLNGHLHGTCWLVPLSSDDDERGTDGEDDDLSEGSVDGFDRGGGSTAMKNSGLGRLYNDNNNGI